MISYGFWPLKTRRNNISSLDDGDCIAFFVAFHDLTVIDRLANVEALGYVTATFTFSTLGRQCERPLHTLVIMFEPHTTWRRFMTRGINFNHKSMCSVPDWLAMSVRIVGDVTLANLKWTRDVYNLCHPPPRAVKVVLCGIPIRGRQMVFL